MMKLFFSELNQRMTETAVDLMGPAGQVDDTPPPALAGHLPRKGGGVGRWQHGFLRARANTIEAGTSEVLRNILAERVLGLPRSR
jgi:alkylation response protein AidB-like acyl-CoA dehydrogenase